MNSGTSFGYTMSNDPSAYYCNVIYSRPTLYYNSSTGLYEDFLDSLSDTSYNKHTEEDISLAKKYFSNYLSDDELVTEQKSGRFWALGKEFGNPLISILLDDDTVLNVGYDTIADKYRDEVEDRNTGVMLEAIRYKKYKGDEQ